MIKSVRFAASRYRNSSFATLPVAKGGCFTVHPSLSRTLPVRFGMSVESWGKRMERDFGYINSPTDYKAKTYSTLAEMFSDPDELQKAYQNYEEKIEKSISHSLAGATAGGGVGLLLGNALQEGQKEEKSGLELFLWGLLGAITGSFIQNEICEALEVDYGLNEHDKIIAKQLCQAGEKMACTLKADPLLQKEVTKLVKLIESGKPTEKDIQQIFKEYIDTKFKEAGFGASLRFGGRNKIVNEKVRDAIAAGVIVLSAIGNSAIAGTLHLCHGLEVPFQFALNRAMYEGIFQAYGRRRWSPEEFKQARDIHSKFKDGLVTINGSERVLQVAGRIFTTATTLGTSNFITLPINVAGTAAAQVVTGGLWLYTIKHYAIHKKPHPILVEPVNKVWEKVTEWGESVLKVFDNAIAPQAYRKPA